MLTCLPNISPGPQNSSSVSICTDLCTLSLPSWEQSQFPASLISFVVLLKTLSHIYSYSVVNTSKYSPFFSTSTPCCTPMSSTFKVFMGHSSCKVFTTHFSGYLFLIKHSFANLTPPVHLPLHNSSQHIFWMIEVPVYMLLCMGWLPINFSDKLSIYLHNSKTQERKKILKRNVKRKEKGGETIARYYNHEE